MKIVVAVRCYNEEKNIDRFMRCYDFADSIVVSDGGSTDNSVEMLKTYPKVSLFHYGNFEMISGQRWNPDGMHMNYVMNLAKQFNPDWLILDDMDDVPNPKLQKDARSILERCDKDQVNLFRLYMWGEDQYFPKMNNYFDPIYRSLWAWKPRNIDIRADEAIRHGTIIGITDDYYGIDSPYCLMHYSWHPDTVEQKMKRYNRLRLPMHHPLSFAGTPEPLPDWVLQE